MAAMPAAAPRSEAPAPRGGAAAGGEALAATCERMADPITGLPILRYRFAGRPALRPGDPAPAGAWRVLRAAESDGRTVLDLEHATGAERVDGSPAAVDDALAEAVLACLRAASACGAAHGDLGAHRVWRRGERVWVEGFGVPWREARDPDGDARALAASLLALPGTTLSPGMRARLDAVRSTGRPDATAASAPSPATAAPTSPPTTPPPAPPSDASGLPPADPPPVALPVAPAAALPAALPAAQPADPPAAPRAEPPVRRGPPPGSRVRAGGIGALAVARAHGHGLVERAAAHRRPMAVALLLGAALWWGLATWGSGSPLRQDAAPRLATPPLAAGAGPTVAAYAIRVRLEPPGHPPASLVVLSSPPGSRWSAGQVIGTVPSVVTLDREGAWRFEARFAGRRSEPADAFLPFDRDVALVFPTPAPAGP